MSMRNVVQVKMNLKTVFKKNDQARQGATATNGEIEMTDFSGHNTPINEVICLYVFLYIKTI